MNDRERDAVIDNRKLRVRCEDAIGEFPRAYAAAGTVDRNFGFGLADEETTLAVWLALPAGWIQDDVEPVRVGQPFPRLLREEFVQGLTRQRVRVLDGELAGSSDAALSFPKGWRHLGEIAAETRDHEQRIEGRSALPTA